MTVQQICSGCWKLSTFLLEQAEPCKIQMLITKVMVQVAVDWLFQMHGLAVPSGGKCSRNFTYCLFWLEWVHCSLASILIEKCHNLFKSSCIFYYTLFRGLERACNSHTMSWVPLVSNRPSFNKFLWFMCITVRYSFARSLINLQGGWWEVN